MMQSVSVPVIAAAFVGAEIYVEPVLCTSNEVSLGQPKTLRAHHWLVTACDANTYGLKCSLWGDCR